MNYNLELQRMVSALIKDVNSSIIPLVKQSNYIADSVIVATFDGWAETINRGLSDILERWTSPIAQSAADRLASKFVKSTINKATENNGAIDVYGTSQNVLNYTEAAAMQNSKLITSIAEKHLEQVSNIVVGNMRQGLRPEAIVKQLMELGDVTKKRAKFIARDQTAKIRGEVNKVRQQDLGFKYFRWLTSHDQRVRHRHSEIAQKETKYGIGTYAWDDLPLSDGGVPIYPGADYQCRCVAQPVTDAQVAKFQKR